MLKEKLDYTLPLFFKRLCRSLIYSFRYKHVKIKGDARISKKVTFGKHVTLGESCILSGNLHVGSYTFINDNCIFDASVEYIGKFCSISHNVKIGMRPHPTNMLSTSPFFYKKCKGLVKENYFDDFYEQETRIEDDVYVASSVIILSGITISQGAVICAGAVVTKDVPPYAVVGGVPAKIIRYRFDIKVIENLLALDIYNKEASEIASMSLNLNLQPTS